MKVHVLYFAALRERVGCAGESVDLPKEVRTAGELQQWLSARGEPWSSAFAETRRVRVAVDQSMTDPTAALRDGAEVAFFPPVTGG